MALLDKHFGLVTFFGVRTSCGNQKKGPGQGDRREEPSFQKRILLANRLGLVPLFGHFLLLLSRSPALLPCSPALLLTFSAFLLLTCCPALLLSFSPAAMLSCSLLCCSSAPLPCCSPALLFSCSAALLLSCSPALLLSCVNVYR